MILRAPQWRGLLARPPEDLAGLLIHGEADRTADHRRDAVRAIAGPEAEGEMRLTRIEPGDLRGDPAAPLDAIKATGFFPGRRVVVIDGVTEPQAKPVIAALADWAPGDAALIITAPALRKTSKLRAAFEGHGAALALALYDDPLDAATLDAMAQGAGLELTEDGRRALAAAAAGMETGPVRQLVEVLALYADGAPADTDAVEAVAPAALDAEVAAVIHAAAEGQAPQVVRLLRRLSGANPVTLAVLATRHMQALHGIALGTGQAWGRDRTAMARQARGWGAVRAADALRVLMDADLALRSAAQAPQMAVIERALLRVAHMAGRE